MNKNPVTEARYQWKSRGMEENILVFGEYTTMQYIGKGVESKKYK